MADCHTQPYAYAYTSADSYLDATADPHPMADRHTDALSPAD